MTACGEASLSVFLFVAVIHLSLQPKQTAALSLFERSYTHPPTHTPTFRFLFFFLLTPLLLLTLLLLFLLLLLLLCAPLFLPLLFCERLGLFGVGAAKEAQVN